MSGDVNYAPGDFEWLFGPTKSSARTLSVAFEANWNYPITVHDRGFSENCFQDRCWAVPYVINASFDAEGKKMLKDAMKEVEMDTCIR